MLLTGFLLACQEWDLDRKKTLDLPSVEVTVPENWKKVVKQGIDSEVGELTNGKETLQYDYGWYTYRFDQETAADYHRTTTTLDGHPALLVRPKQKGKGVIGVLIQVDSLNRFALLGKDIKNEKQILNIFHSIQVK
jgi:hypothetical protein